MPKELKDSIYFANRCIVGKWHYHYENENGRIGLVRFNYSHTGFFDKNRNFCYEACGALDFEQFQTLSQAEYAIYKKLGENYLFPSLTKIPIKNK